MPNVAQAAIDAIGAEQPGDWQLKPERHAALLAPSAGALKRILLRPELQQVIEAFNVADQKAGVAQDRYKLFARISAITSFATVVIASVLLLPQPDQISPGLLSDSVVLQCGLLAISFASSLWLNYKRPFDDWMRQRAEAESKRVELFDRVVAASEIPQTGELPLLPLQLEYVRRFQLDVQSAYYKGRGRQHQSAAWHATIWRSVALLIVAIAAIPMIDSLRGGGWLPSVVDASVAILPKPGELAQRLFLSLGLVGGALQGLLASYGLLSQHERNASRYLDTSRNLEDLAGRPLEEARIGAAADDSSRVLTFVALLHQQISSEHREWVALRSIAPELSLDRLKELSLPRL